MLQRLSDSATLSFLEALSKSLLFSYVYNSGSSLFKDGADRKRKLVAKVPLSDGFFNPEILYNPGKLDEFLVGLATQPRQKYDNIITEQVTNHLFQPNNKTFGMDLIALNLQRARDHGIPGYNAFRQVD